MKLYIARQSPDYQDILQVHPPIFKLKNIFVFSNQCNKQWCSLSSITARAVAQCSIKDDLSSEGKTPKFDCFLCSNPVTDHNKTWQNNNVHKTYKCASFNCDRFMIDATTWWLHITPKCSFLGYVCLYVFFSLPKVHSPNHSTDPHAQKLNRRGLSQESALWSRIVTSSGSFFLENYFRRLCGNPSQNEKFK